MTLALATRRSRLALWQAERAQEILAAALADDDVELVRIESEGDLDQRSELASLGSVGVFTVAIDEAVLTGRAHIGVHSLKDMTTTLADGLVLGGVLARGPVEDTLISASGSPLTELPQGARVATGSIRRAAQLRRARPDLRVVPIRGNVETRLARLDEGAAEAILLARAGLERLGLGDRITEVLDAERFLPAVGQGIVGLTCRAGDEDTLARLAAISDREAWAEALAERALLRALRGGCNAPVASRARAVEGSIAQRARVLSADGTECLEEQGATTVERAEELGRELAQRLADRGAEELIADAREG